MTNENAITIVGYEEDGHCEHCGRALRHCIRISDGRIVGATCFNKFLTKPRQYMGKPYRVGPENIVRLAKIAQFYVPASWGPRFGLQPGAMEFTQA